MLEFRAIPSEATRPLRHEVLRPNQPFEETKYPLDDYQDSFHVGAFLDGNLVGVASIFHEDREGTLGAGSWRVRGMCVKRELQGRGMGKALLAACVHHAEQLGGKVIWCNGRTTAAGFYKRAGFEAEGDEFEIPGIGPHYVFIRSGARETKPV